MIMAYSTPLLKAEDWGDGEKMKLDYVCMWLCVVYVPRDTPLTQFWAINSLHLSLYLSLALFFCAALMCCLFVRWETFNSIFNYPLKLLAFAHFIY